MLDYILRQNTCRSYKRPCIPKHLICIPFINHKFTDGAREQEGQARGADA